MLKHMDSPAWSAPYDTASALAPWLNPEVGMETRYSPGSDYTGLLQNLQPMVRSLVPLGRSAPGAGVQTCCGIHGRLCYRLGSHVQRHAVSGVWTGPQLCWHINCLELLASTPCHEPPQRAPSVQEHSGLYDNTATIAYIIRQGGLRSHRMSQLARQLLLWSQKHLRSLRAIHIPGVFNRAADELSRAALPGEWRVHPQAVQLIWGWFRAAQVDLFASPEATHCQEFYSLTEAMLGTDALAHS